MDYFPCNQSNHRNQGFQDNQPCELDIALPANPLQENNHYPNLSKRRKSLSNWILRQRLQCILSSKYSLR